MSLYPSTPKPQYPMVTRPKYKTAVTGFETGAEFRRQLWTFPKRSVSLKYGPLTQSEIDTLYNFFATANGSFGTFTFAWPFSESITNEYVGRGDGAVVVFDIPSTSTNSGTLVVNVDGVPTSVTFGSGTGYDGRDRVTFASAPANGSTVTMFGDGILTLKMRFEEDELDKEMFRYVLYNVGVKLMEVR